MAKNNNPANTASGTADDYLAGGSERPDLVTGTYEIHPQYVVTAGGVGSFAKGDVVQAGDLGSAADIQRLHEELGAIAPWGGDDANKAQADAAADAAVAPPAPLQQGVPYVDTNAPEKPEGSSPNPAV